MKNFIEEPLIPDLEKLVQSMFSKFTELYPDLLGKITSPSIRLAVFPDLKRYKIASRDFNREYLEPSDQVGGNLYKWIHQSFSVLFDIDKEKREIILYSSTNNKLGARFATLLRMNTKPTVDGVYSLCINLALFDFFRDEINITEQKQFILLDNNFDNQKIHARFRKMFIKDFNSDNL